MCTFNDYLFTFMHFDNNAKVGQYVMLILPSAVISCPLLGCNI